MSILVFYGQRGTKNTGLVEQQGVTVSLNPRHAICQALGRNDTPVPSGWVCAFTIARNIVPSAEQFEGDTFHKTFTLSYDPSNFKVVCKLRVQDRPLYDAYANTVHGDVIVPCMASVAYELRAQSTISRLAKRFYQHALAGLDRSSCEGLGEILMIKDDEGMIEKRRIEEQRLQAEQERQRREDQRISEEFKQRLRLDEIRKAEQERIRRDEERRQEEIENERLRSEQDTEYSSQDVDGFPDLQKDQFLDLKDDLSKEYLDDWDKMSASESEEEYSVQDECSPSASSSGFGWSPPSIPTTTQRRNSRSEPINKRRKIEEEEDDTPPEPQWLYPPVPYPTEIWQREFWQRNLKQGESGYSEFLRQGCEELLKTDSVKNSKLQPNQAIAAAVLHPDGPGVHRLLVCHATGKGKSFLAINVLDMYYFAKRPVVFLAPTLPTRQAVFKEIMKWPSRWRDFVSASLEGTDGWSKDWRNRRQEVWKQDYFRTVDLKEVERILALKKNIKNGVVLPSWRKKWKERYKNDPPPPTAPFRAYSYTTKAACGDKDPICQGQWSSGFNNKIVICDEVHRIVQECLPAQMKNLKRVRGLAYKAENVVFIGLTGSPIQNDTEDAQKIMKMVRGRQYKDCSDDGFISYDMTFPVENFPRVSPDCQIGPLENSILKKMIKTVDMNYGMMVEYQSRCKQLSEAPELGRISRLQNYVNLKWYYPTAVKFGNENLLKIKNAPKLHAAAAYVRDYYPAKIVICIRRRTGLQAFVYILTEIMKDAGKKISIGVYSDTSTAPPLTISIDMNRAQAIIRTPTTTAELEWMFNSGKIDVMVLDTEIATEGISLLRVAWMILVDMPRTYAEFRQVVGRAIRFNSHSDLPPNQREVNVRMLVGTFPEHEGIATKLDWFLESSAASRRKQTKMVTKEVQAKTLQASWECDSIEDVVQGQVTQESLKNKKANDMTIDEELLVKLFECASEVAGTEEKLRVDSFDGEIYLDRMSTRRNDINDGDVSEIDYGGPLVDPSPLKPPKRPRRSSLPRPPPTPQP